MKRDSRYFRSNICELLHFKFLLHYFVLSCFATKVRMVMKCFRMSLVLLLILLCEHILLLPKKKHILLCQNDAMLLHPLPCEDPISAKC
jgi:hypothetical protein